MRFGDMFEISIFLAVIGVCLFAAFTSLHHTTVDVTAMQEYHTDTRALRQRDSSRLDYAYLGRPGAYLDVARLSLSVAAASADKRADIRIFDTIIEPYDMYSLNVLEMSDLTPMVYNKLQSWWDGFKNSSEYKDNAWQTRLFDYSGVNTARTFNPAFVKDTVTGFLTPNPTTLDECRFKLQVVEVGIGADNIPILEYHIFIFLGSLTKIPNTTSSVLENSAQVEYRWYECVIGKSGVPWVIL